MTTVNKRNAAATILLAMVTAGILDALAAMIMFMVRVPGGNPLKVWRFVASGALGPGSLTNSLVPMALAGLLFHFIIAGLFSLFFYFLFSRIKWFKRNLVITGLVYGIFVWIVMNLIIVPLSNIPSKSKLWALVDGRLTFQFPSDPTQLIIGILVLMFCVGLPVSLIIGSYFRKLQQKIPDMKS